MTAKARSDRRVLPRRVPFQGACVVDLPSGTRLETTLVNLNMVGGYVAASEAPTLGERVTVRFHLPAEDTGTDMALAGIVMWVHDGPSAGPDAPPGFGVQFVGTSLEENAALLRFVEQHATVPE